MRSRWKCCWISLWLSVMAIVPLRGDDPPVEEGVSPLVRQMTTRLEGVQVFVFDQTVAREVRMIDRPVFRYSDQERFIDDATLWLWTDRGRPVALQKEEAGNFQGKPVWTVCFASFSSGPVEARWPRDERQMTTKEAGCDFRAIPNGPEPAANARLAAQQLKQLARRFTAAHRGEADGRVEARLLPRPIYEYSAPDDGISAGAIFGFAGHGTNPDGYILIELRKDSPQEPWVYGCARMTTAAVEVSLDGQPVWSCDEVPPEPKYFDTWTFFFEPRTAEVTP
jgi:hypothetical protein